MMLKLNDETSDLFDEWPMKILPPAVTCGNLCVIMDTGRPHIRGRIQNSQKNAEYESS